MAEQNPFLVPGGGEAQGGNFDPAGRNVDAGRGIEWLKQGWQLFTKNPGMWIAIAVILLVIFIVLSFIPVVGGLAAQFLTLNSELLDNLRTITKGLTNDSKDPVLITKALINYFTGQVLDPLYELAAIEYFKAGVPSGYFTNGTWDLNYDEAPLQIVNLLKYLVKLPEYQLS